MSGKFFCLEGIDGAGKSTLAAAIMNKFLNLGIDAVLLDKKTTNFDNPFVRNHMTAIKDALWNYPKDADIEALGDFHWLHLLASWYAVLDVQIITPARREGKWILADGWIFKYIARFSLKPNIGLNYARKCFEGLTKPDFVYYLNIAPHVAFARRASFRPTELGFFDGQQGSDEASYIAYQSRVREVYKRLTQDETWRIIDAETQSSDELIDSFDHMFTFARHGI